MGQQVPRGTPRRGDVIIANINDEQGRNPKERPALILSSTEDIAAGWPIVVCAITTTYPEPPPVKYVPLPWSADGSATTRLRRRSAAVPAWAAIIDEGDILATYGYVRASTLNDILMSLSRG